MLRAIRRSGHCRNGGGFVSRGGAMAVTVEGQGHSLRERLRARLDDAAKLKCDEHGESVVAVHIYGRENGWFDTRWTTCCEKLEREAGKIVKERC